MTAGAWSWLSPRPAWEALKREWLLYHLGDQRFRFMWDPAPPDEWVSLDCETTGLNTKTDEIIAIGAVRVQGQRILTSERLELIVRPEKRKFTAESVRVHRLRERDVAHGISAEDAMHQLMQFIGSRPLVGYYLEFDVAMIHRVLFPMLGMGLPQPKIEVSSMFYDHKFRTQPPSAKGLTNIDLRFSTMMSELALPEREAHDAVNDAVMTAMAFIKLRHLLKQAPRVPTY